MRRGFPAREKSLQTGYTLPHLGCSCREGERGCVMRLFPGVRGDAAYGGGVTAAIIQLAGKRAENKCLSSGSQFSYGGRLIKNSCYSPTGELPGKADAQVAAEGTWQPLERHSPRKSKKLTPEWSPRALENHSSVTPPRNQRN